MSEWLILDHVHWKYHQSTKYIQQCTDVQSLDLLAKQFSPSTPMRNYVEWIYVTGIFKLVKKRFNELKVDIMDDDDCL